MEKLHLWFMLCHLSKGYLNSCLSTPDRALQTKEMISPKSSLVNHWVYWGYRKWMTQRQLNHWKAHSAWAMTHEGCILGAPCITHRSGRVLYQRGEGTCNLVSFISSETCKLLLPSQILQASFLPSKREYYDLEEIATQQTDLEKNNFTLRA